MEPILQGIKPPQQPQELQAKDPSPKQLQKDEDVSIFNIPKK